MTLPLIAVEDVGKCYTISHGRPKSGANYRRLSEEVVQRTRSAISRLGRFFHASSLESTQQEVGSVEQFWALRHVSFELKEGQAIGIIGRNGAGKSTLLKILSRITEPSEGRVVLRGRVASLLEVGTGFHPELTGRENIFLNGAILGMARAEIRRRFDEIVEFAELAKFLETPVKRYSSGMYVRLAFAVAAHLDSDILVVDEVLAVGDLEFQKRCLAKMEDVSNRGRAVIFVTHALPLVARLCDRAILLDAGSVRLDSSPPAVAIQQYITGDSRQVASRNWRDGSGPGDDHARLTEVRVEDCAGMTREQYDVREAIRVSVIWWNIQGARVAPRVLLFDQDGTHVFLSVGATEECLEASARGGAVQGIVTIPGNLLNEGMYNIAVGLSSIRPLSHHCHERDVLSLQVVDGGIGLSARRLYTGPIGGVVRPMLDWTISRFKPNDQ